MLRLCYPPARVSLSSTSTYSAFLDRFLARLRSSIFLPIVGGLAIAVNLGTLSLGLLSDDYFHALSIFAYLTHTAGNAYWWELFGIPAARGPSIPALIASGVAPWWTSPNYSSALFRPLAVASHYFDYLVLGGDPVRMHAHNLLWYSLLTALVALCHRRFVGRPATAFFATMMYVLDEAHTEGVAWIAGRNTLMSACAAAAALLLHDRARRVRSRPAEWQAAVCTGLGLAAGEGGLAAWGLLLGHALILDSGSPRDRARALLPHLALTVVWGAIYKILGYGARGGGIYIDPFSSPLTFIAHLPKRLGLVWLEMFTVSASAYGDLPRFVVSLLRFGMIASCVGLTVFIVRVARTDRYTRFWLVSTVLSVLPFCSTLSGARLLFTPSIGGSAVLALPIVYALDAWAARQRSSQRLHTFMVVGLAGFCIAIHLVAAPATIPLRLRQLEEVALDLRLLAATLPVPASDGPPKTVFVLNTANYLASAATPFSREPGHGMGAFYILGGNLGTVTVTRMSETVLQIQPKGGFLTEPTAAFVRDPDVGFRLGERYSVGPAEVRVVEVTEKGRAARVELELPNLEDPNLIWTYWSGLPTGYLAVTLPPIGTAVKLPVHPLVVGPQDEAWP